MRKTAILLIFSVLINSLYSQDYLTLKRCRELAIENNKTLKISEEEVISAHEMKKATFTKLLPKIAASGGWKWNQKTLSLLENDALLPIGSMMQDGSFGFRPEQINNQWSEIAPGIFAPLDSQGKPFDPKQEPDKIIWKDYALLPKDAVTMKSHNVFMGGITLTQPLFMGGKIRELYNITKSQANIANISMNNTTEEILLEVDEAYWRVVSLKHKKDLANRYLKLLEKLESDINAMVNEGFATKGDVLKIRVKLNEAQMTLNIVENGLSLSTMALLQMCGIDINSTPNIDYTIDSGEYLIQDSINISNALLKRSEIKTLEEFKKITESNLKLTKGRFLPDIAVQGAYNISNPNAFNGIQQNFDGSFSIGLMINIPIFNFGERGHLVKAAKSRQNIVSYRIEDAKEKIELQITQTNYRLNEAQKRVIMSSTNLEKADENLKFANEAFKEGYVNTTDVMEAQTAWLSANSQLIDSKIDLLLCNLYLKKALAISIIE